MYNVQIAYIFLYPRMAQWRLYSKSDRSPRSR